MFYIVEKEKTHVLTLLTYYYRSDIVFFLSFIQATLCFPAEQFLHSNRAQAYAYTWYTYINHLVAIFARLSSYPINEISASSCTISRICSSALLIHFVLRWPRYRYSLSPTWLSAAPVSMPAITTLVAESPGERSADRNPR